MSSNVFTHYDVYSAVVSLQLISWNYGQFSMSIALYWVDPVIWALECKVVSNSFLNTYPKECFEYLDYPSSPPHFILSIIP